MTPILASSAQALLWSVTGGAFHHRLAQRFLHAQPTAPGNSRKAHPHAPKHSNRVKRLSRWGVTASRISLAAGSQAALIPSPPVTIMSAKPRKPTAKKSASKRVGKADRKNTAISAGAHESGQEACIRNRAGEPALGSGWDSVPGGGAGNEPKPVLEILGLAHLKARGKPGMPFDPVEFRSIGPMATPAASSATVRGSLTAAGITPTAEIHGRAGLLRKSHELARRALLNEKWQAVENGQGEGQLARAVVESLTTQFDRELAIILRLLNERSFNPKPSRQPELNWSTISVVLASMPHRFRNDALCMMSLGTNRFGKVPFTFNNPDNTAEGSRVTGPPRPMGCPEAAPRGSDFALAWMIGRWWDWRLPGGNSNGGDDDWIADMIGGEITGMLLTLKDCRSAGQWHWSKRAGHILDSLGAEAGEKLTRHHDVFRAGANFAALVLFGNDTRLVGYHTTEQECNQWPEIFRHALLRHGKQMKPAKLLEALDPIAWRRKPEKGPDGVAAKYATPDFEWPFVPVGRLQIHNAIRSVSGDGQLDQPGTEGWWLDCRRLSA